MTDENDMANVPFGCFWEPLRGYT